MSLAPFPLEADVLAYIRDVFEIANMRVTANLDRMPTTHEQALDFAFIGALSEAHGPHMTTSGVLVDVDAHFVGGGWHWERWEIADIGLIIAFRRGEALLRTKVVLLQSKRLYPRESEFVEDQGVARAGGFGSLMIPSLPATLGLRNFRFDESCCYKALQVGDNQWRAIAGYEAKYAIPVHYMLYHPGVLPYECRIPVKLPVAAGNEKPVVGVRVVPGRVLRSRVGNASRNYAPAYRELANDGVLGWALPDFIVDEVLTCREGYIADDAENEGLNVVFYQRNAPIAAAIRIAITVPE